jgi:NADH-quinone oxidoreductase subunit L
MSQTLTYWLLPLLPLAGSGLNGIFGRKLPRAATAAIALLATAASFALAAYLFLSFQGQTLSLQAAPWISVANFHADFNLYVDHLTLLMLMVVTGVGFLIHVYSAGYMAHEDGYWRFFSYLNLFMFFMLVLVLAGNFLLMFVGWEGVGLASYLLIGFYYRRPSAASAGKKAFVVNRVGDFGFLLAMFLLIAHFGSLNYADVFAAIHAAPGGASTALYTAIALLMLLGATGKSAQIPLYVWLPDAMEGPTPVSALIHAATMVTAGVYMISRSHLIFHYAPAAMTVVAIIGAATAFFAATIGMVQTDIKRVLAYSTISQLGYMFLACGVAAYSAGIFHLMTHAFFKALLFLAAGSVIHSLNGEQDMRAMGGLRKHIPITFWTMTAATLAITGFFPFAGFFSKDAILYEAFASGGVGILYWAMGLITAFLTSFYMFRLWYLTFFGDLRGPLQPHTPEPGHTAEAAHGHAHDPHESPWSMLAPLVILALLSLVGGWIGWPEALGGSNHFASFLAPVFADIQPAVETASSGPHMELMLAIVSLATAAFGWFLADLFYRRRPGLPGELAAKASGLYKLLAGKYWIDELYAAVIVRPLEAGSHVVLFRGVDNALVDGATRASVATAQGASGVVRRMQSGNIRSYAGWIAFGAAALLILALEVAK